MLFDEPTTGLDPLLGKSIHRLIGKMHATFGFTGVIVSHDIPEVFKISDRVAMLANGVIAEAVRRKNSWRRKIRWFGSSCKEMPKVLTVL